VLRDEAQRVDTAEAGSAASFAAIHHPWLLQRDADDRLRAHPPTGALMGLLARRSRQHGAWGAPGADPLPTALMLTGDLQGADVLEALGANPLALRSDGIAAVRSQTLSLDVDWTAIGVRRLFILLRRLCRREGQRFVFEPNDLTLRRGLERSFDALLHRLMQRGAFRGVDAKSSYLLKTASGADALREIERGECSLLIQVAPSYPLRFLTLHLRRSGEQLLIEER
jgi:phage tail sheath protein FI